MEKELIQTNASDAFCIEKEVSERITVLRYILACLVVFFHNNKTLLFLGDSSKISFTDITFLGHFFSFALFFLITIAPVPLFFIFAAYINESKQYTLAVTLRKKTKSLLIPLLAWTSLVTFGKIGVKFLLITMFPDKVSHTLPFISGDEVWSLKQWIFAFIGNYDNPFTSFLCEPYIMPLYFIRDLFILSLIHPLLKKIINRIPFAFGCFLFVIYYLRLRPVIVCSNALTFYSAGIYFAKYRFNFFEFADRIKWIHIAVASAALIFISVMIHNIQHGFNVFISCLILLKISKVLLEANDGKISNLLKKLSFFSFFIYAMHLCGPLQFASQKWFKYIPSNVATDIIEYFLVPVFVCAAATLTGLFLKRFIPKFFSLLNGGR